MVGQAHPQPSSGYTLAGNGVITAEGAFVPNDPSNLNWQAYQDWLGLGHTPAADPNAPIAAIRAAAKLDVDRTAAGKRQALSSAGAPDTLLRLLRFEEAVAVQSDGSPTGVNYPLLNAECAYNGTTIAGCGTNVRAEKATLRTNLAAIEAARLAGRAAIDAAANAGAVAAAVAAIVWP